MTTEKMKKWTRPRNYIGADWPDYYVFLGRHRDSDALVRSNFDCALRDVGGESETVFVVSENHWAVGWIEWIAIHESDIAAIDEANKILDDLESYPVVDEVHFSELEWEEAQQAWENCSLRERIELCADDGISIFAARRDCMPAGDSGRIFDRLRG